MLKYLVEGQGVESIAISYLCSYKNSIHERRTAEILKRKYPKLFFSASSVAVNEYREYERTSTTVLDAYIKPILANYLQRLGEALSDKGFRGLLLIMRSDGGVMDVETAAASPISTVQSGPAGGVVGARFLSTFFKKNKLITMDIGGTSLDVCIIEDEMANVVRQSYMEHYPLLMTMYDIRSIGAGADPGPMCYSRGGGNRPSRTPLSSLDT